MRVRVTVMVCMGARLGRKGRGAVARSAVGGVVRGPYHTLHGREAVATSAAVVVGAAAAMVRRATTTAATTATHCCHHCGTGVGRLVVAATG